MNFNSNVKYRQYLISIGAVLLLTALCFVFKDFIHYQLIALILLLGVSILAILYDIKPVMISAILSAVFLNYFFIEPTFHYKIDSVENIFLFFIYLLVALINAVFTYRIKKQDMRIREKEEKVKTIKLYDTLLNSLSHELRTPISTIIGAIDTLKTHDIMLSAYHRLELLDEIEVASMRLNRQVSNLLNMNRLETGNLKLRKDWSDINELVFLTLEKIPDSGDYVIVFNPDDALPLFKIDSGIMEQVLNILVHNAVTYTSINTIVKIEVSNEDDTLKIVVSDNGKGIPEDQHERVFEKFYRLPNSKPGGSGLGLSIAKGFVEAHNGTIKLENALHGGAKFTVLIPAETSYLKNLNNE